MDILMDILTVTTYGVLIACGVSLFVLIDSRRRREKRQEEYATRFRVTAEIPAMEPQPGPDQ